MAYMSSTSTSPNVPSLLVQGVYRESPSSGTVAPSIWTYKSTHVSSDIEAVNFFTDGQKLGFLIGDLLIHSEVVSSGVITSHRIVAVGSTTTDVGIGTTLGIGA